MNGQESGELAHRFLLAARGKFKLRCFDTLDAAVRFVVAHDDTVEEDDVDHYIDMLGIAEHVLDEDMAQRDCPSVAGV